MAPPTNATWGAKAGSAALISSCFPGFAPSRQYSAKACSLRNVPFGDRVLGVTMSSQHESLSMVLSGAASAAPREATSVAEVDEGASDDYDISVATRKFGLGRICYIGDVNCESETAELTAAFCSAPSGFSSNALMALAALTPAEFSEVQRLKAEGNARFGVGDFPGANQSYGDALLVFGSRHGSEGGQRDEFLKINSNVAETLLRIGWNEQALTTVAMVLALDPSNGKARFRRAKALAALASFTDALTELKTLEATAPDIASTKSFKMLAASVKAKVKQARNAEGAGLRRAFATGGGGLGGGGSSSSSGACWGGPAAWGKGLDSPARYEWLVDCYRMRLDEHLRLLRRLLWALRPGAHGSDGTGAFPPLHQACSSPRRHPPRRFIGLVVG